VVLSVLVRSVSVISGWMLVMEMYCSWLGFQRMEDWKFRTLVKSLIWREIARVSDRQIWGVFVRE